MEAFGLALTFDDVRFCAGYSEIQPSQADLASKFSRNVSMKMPLVSSPMDTVTESEMAIAMAKLGGLGVIHKALSPKDQAAMVQKVKHCLTAFLTDPICVVESQTMGEVLAMAE